MKKRWHARFAEHLARSAEFPVECCGVTPVIEIRGGDEVTVTGCRRIVGYTGDTVSIDGGSAMIEICGSGLVMSDFTSGCVSVRGKVTDVHVGTSCGGAS